MSKRRPKRFYDDVAVAQDGDSYLVKLDGRTLKTPGKLTLTAPSENIARLIAAEWRAQDGDINPETMPVTRLVNVALELTPHHRPKLAKEARAYGSTDMLCHRDVPGALARHQAEHWDPLLEWARTRGINLRSESSVLALEQDPHALDNIAKYASGLDDLNLTLFMHLTAVFGSVIMAMAVLERELTGASAFDLSRLDADWQARQWGEDEEAKAATDHLAAETVSLCLILET